MSMRDQPKTRPFAIRLTEEERFELERRAGELALGAYIKGILFQDMATRRSRGARKPVKDHAALAQVLACLGSSRLPESLERLSHATETGVIEWDDDAPVAIKLACEDIAMMRLLLMRALGFQLPDELPTESLSQTFTRAGHDDPDRDARQP